MILSESAAVSTKALTNSFQWDYQESFAQQDAQVSKNYAVIFESGIHESFVWRNRAVVWDQSYLWCSGGYLRWREHWLHSLLGVRLPLRTGRQVLWLTIASAQWVRQCKRQTLWLNVFRSSMTQLKKPFLAFCNPRFSMGTMRMRAPSATRKPERRKEQRWGSCQRFWRSNWIGFL